MLFRGTQALIWDRVDELRPSLPRLPQLVLPEAPERVLERRGVHIPCAKLVAPLDELRDRAVTPDDASEFGGGTAR